MNRFARANAPLKILRAERAEGRFLARWFVRANAPLKILRAERAEGRFWALVLHVLS
jgi:hypothetical protein